MVQHKFMHKLPAGPYSRQQEWYTDRNRKTTPIVTCVPLRFLRFT
jgi:hypothetical protein